MSNVFSIQHGRASHRDTERSRGGPSSILARLLHVGSHRRRSATPAFQLRGLQDAFDSMVAGPFS